MKEVTICFSFSVKDGLTRNSLKDLNTLHGLSTDGVQTSRMRSNALNYALLLLKEISGEYAMVTIKSIALSERKPAIPLGDLKHEIPTSAKSDNAMSWKELEKEYDIKPIEGE